MVSRIAGSPVLVRVIPFAVFLACTALQGSFGKTGTYWVYLFKTLAGAGLIWLMRPFVEEMRWKWSLPAVGVGVGVFVMWVGLDSWYPKLNEVLARLGLAKAPAAASLWDPGAAFGHGSFAAWFFVMVRIAGSALVVPPLEEVFYRSFLYRYLAGTDFLAVSLGALRWVPFLLTSLVFGLAHHQWLAGILCGLAYQALVCFKGRLGDAMAAHAVTNLLLGVYVAWRGAWQFW